MKIPAEAFAWTSWSDLVPGQLVQQGDVWLLLVDIAMRDQRSRPALILTGENAGDAIDLARTETTAFLTIGGACSWRPMLEALPAAVGVQSEPGALLIGPQGPFLRTWYQGESRYAFDFHGTDVTDRVPARCPSAVRWSMGLFGPGLSAPAQLFVAGAVESIA